MKLSSKLIYPITFALFVVYLLFRLGYDISKIEMYAYIVIFTLFISKGMFSYLENRKKR